MAGERLVNIMNSVRGEDRGDATDLIFGVVTQINPLKVKVDSRFEVTSEFLTLSNMCKAKSVSITLPDTSVVEIQLWRGLIVGDKVRMLRVSKGQAFYVLEREE